MTLMDVLATRVAIEIPAVEAHLDVPKDEESGTWRLNIASHNRHIVVEWKNGHSFILYDQSDALTPRGSSNGHENVHEEVCGDLDHAMQAILNLLVADIVE